MVGRRPGGGRPRRGAPSAGRPAGRGGRPRGAGRARRRAPRRRPSWPGSGRSCPGLAFLVPGVGAQGGEADAGPRAPAPRRRRPAGSRPGGGLLVNVSRGIAGAALGRPPEGTSADPGRAARRRRASLGGHACLCYRSSAREGAGARAAARRHRAHREVAQTMPNIGPVELIIILVIALLILGPGKLPDVGLRAREEHPRVPQGRHRRAGRGQARRHDRTAARRPSRRARPAAPPSPGPAAAARPADARTGHPGRPATTGRARTAGRARRPPRGRRPGRGQGLARTRDRARHGRRRPRPRRRRPRLRIDARARRAAAGRPPTTRQVMPLVDHLARAAPPDRDRSPRRRPRDASSGSSSRPAASSRSSRLPTATDPLLLLGPGRGLLHLPEDRPRGRDRPGDAGHPLAALALHLARPDPRGAPPGPAVGPARARLLRRRASSSPTSSCRSRSPSC